MNATITVTITTAITPYIPNIINMHTFSHIIKKNSHVIVFEKKSTLSIYICFFLSFLFFLSQLITHTQTSRTHKLKIKL